ncbi:MAG: hypothetical protein ICV84_13420, partial [Flavisolibacter sp.]|nr:hypothetical protein [Flavisolibacter sp.]
MKISKILIVLFFSILLVPACKKEKLLLNNPNSPTPETSLTTEQGLINFALGIMYKTLADVPEEGLTNIMHVMFTNHSALGDEVFQP